MGKPSFLTGKIKFATWGKQSLLLGENKVCYLGKTKFVTWGKLSLLPGENEVFFTWGKHSLLPEENEVWYLGKMNFVTWVKRRTICIYPAFTFLFTREISFTRTKQRRIFSWLNYLKKHYTLARFHYTTKQFVILV